MQTVATTPQPLSAGAERMRRTRSRRRQGHAIVSFEVSSSVVGALIALGWLPEPDRANKAAITRALIDLYGRAIQARVTPAMGVQDHCFMCTIQRSTIETLVSLGWLRADDQDDLAAIVKGFRGFAARALAVARNERP